MNKQCCNLCDENEDDVTLYNCIYCNDDDNCYCKDCLEEHLEEHSQEIIDKLIEIKIFNSI